VLSEDQHEGAVAALYAAALGHCDWPAALELVAGLFGAGTAVLTLSDADRRVQGVELTGRHTVAFALDYYAGEVYANDPRTPFLIGSPPGAVYYDHRLYDVEAMDRDPRCRAAGDILGVKYSLGVTLALPGAASASLAILTTEAEGHASQDAIRSFERLAPHIGQACGLGRIVGREVATRHALLGVLAQGAEGVILLGADGRPVLVNDLAEAMIGAEDGLSLIDGRLATRRPPETRRLQQLIGTALDRARLSETAVGGRMLVSRPSGRHPYALSVLPAPPIEPFLAAGAIGCVIHLQDLAAVRLPSRDLLCGAFGFTERESDLAVELVRCAGLAPAAALAGMAVNTARTHLQSLFRKTGTASQTQLVQLLSRLS
jgi:DNA-binding CsgD family transcriptional regulator